MKMRFGSRARRMAFVIAGGTLVIGGGVFLVECASPDDGSASAAKSAGATTTTAAALSDSDQSCPSPTPVPPQQDPDTMVMCHPSSCTPGLCSRGDISPLNKPASDPDKATIDPLLH